MINHKKLHMISHSNLDSIILDMIKKRSAVTTQEVALALGISWNTAEKNLLELVIDTKIIKIKKPGVNVWLLNDGK